MKQFLCILVAAVFLSIVIDASSDDSDRNAETLRNVNERNPDGSYFYEYHLTNGAWQRVTGTLKDVNGVKIYSVEGSYSYRQKNGKSVVAKYIADENGYRVLPVDEISYSVPVSISQKAIASLVG